MHAVLSRPEDHRLTTEVATQPVLRSLSGRTAIVTGSTRGIGEGIARALAEAGCNLVLNGRRSSEEGEPFADAIAATWNVEVRYHAADLRTSSHVERLAAYAQEQFGTVDILVNNAGIQHVAPIEAFADECWDNVLSLNLTAAFHAIKGVLPGMRTHGWGRIINIASVHSLVASPNKCAYVAAKHGLLGLTKVVALETANDGITCNAICPGWVLTELVQHQVEARATASGMCPEEARIDLLRAKQPMFEFSSVESIGALTVFLCSSHARTMTGAAYTMDGGWAAV
ncbi:3-hydroxybutyrate dehydrogenase [Microvirga yunnanensis]|uniref:3-hydroxybutyrate dehydrogenase n=1 Tax=Microvirga yunnanensis TaxID=2953740 RepID=UPI0021C8DC78|nr:3-hydroxybutyrate dehydrogenase [Microvirga sp. HBU65207]